MKCLFAKTPIAFLFADAFMVFHFGFQKKKCYRLSALGFRTTGSGLAMNLHAKVATYTEAKTIHPHFYGTHFMSSSTDED